MLHPNAVLDPNAVTGKITSISFTPGKAGIFPFHCDNFCGSGHEAMTGTIKVIE